MCNIRVGFVCNSGVGFVCNLRVGFVCNPRAGFVCNPIVGFVSNPKLLVCLNWPDTALGQKLGESSSKVGCSRAKKGSPVGISES